MINEYCNENSETVIHKQKLKSVLSGLEEISLVQEDNFVYANYTSDELEVGGNILIWF